MPKSVLSEKRFHDEEAAYAWIEARLWPNGPVCPHCGGVERISKMNGKSTRLSRKKCIGPAFAVTQERFVFLVT